MPNPIFSYLPQMRITKWAPGLRIYNDHPNTRQYLEIKEKHHELPFLKFLLTIYTTETGQHVTLPDSISGRL